MTTPIMLPYPIRTVIYQMLSPATKSLSDDRPVPVIPKLYSNYVQHLILRTREAKRYASGKETFCYCARITELVVGMSVLCVVHGLYRIDQAKNKKCDCSAKSDYP